MTKWILLLMFITAGGNEMNERPETGSMQFGDDWPGVFIRGDNALAMANMLELTLESARKSDDTPTLVLMGLSTMIHALRVCSIDGGPDVQKMKAFEECKNNG